MKHVSPEGAHGALLGIAAAVSGQDPGDLVLAESLSHRVYVGPHRVVKVIDAARGARLEREVALAVRLPEGVTARLLDSGLRSAGGHEFRYACYERVPGRAPGMGLPGVDVRTARSLAAQAVERLRTLHEWDSPVKHLLHEPLDHGGFTGRADLVALAERLSGAVRPDLAGGLAVIAERAPEHARAVVPVHADCHWGNWLADDGRLTALLDFEWARFGEPLDDWFFLIGLAGPHRGAVLDVVARKTGTSRADLRYAVEIRHASYLASDILLALSRPSEVAADLLATRLRGLERLVSERH